MTCYCVYRPDNTRPIECYVVADRIAWVVYEYCPRHGLQAVEGFDDMTASMVSADSQKGNPKEVMN
jgi:hypothetical protein